MTNTVAGAPDNTQAKEPMTPKPGDKCVTVIFNPVSGTGDPDERRKAISDALAEHGYTCQIEATTKENGAGKMAHEALSRKVDLLVVSGGDGTVMEVLQAAIGSNVPVAVIPAGTGNLLSVNLGIPSKVPDAVHIALSGKPFKLDLGKTGNGEYFAIMGGIGLDAQMIHDADREAKRKLGKAAYLWAALKNIKRRHAYVEITLDGQAPLRRRAKMVIVANMGKVTGGLEAIPTASPNDGLLDVGIVSAETMGQWLRLIGYALMGRTQSAPELDVRQAKKIRIRTPWPQPAQLDGESEGDVELWDIEAVPEAVQIMLPIDAPAAADTKTSPEKAAAEQADRNFGFLTGVLVSIALIVFLVKRKRQ